MSYRQLVIFKECHLSIKNSNISIKQGEHINTVPLKDIAIIVVDHSEVSFSTMFFSECAKEHISIMICGENHMPCSITNSINQHYRPFQVFKFQSKLTEKQKSQFAEYLIKNKILNQKRVLEYTTKDENAIELLSKYYNELEGNDEFCREGTAAKVFFNSLYGHDFIRFEEDTINGALNYGYGVIRSLICRLVNSYGLCSYIGVKHKGNTNPYNLIYDLIEPFRPIVDYYIASNFDKLVYDLDIQTRKELVNLLNANIKVNEKNVTLQYGAELLVKSFLRNIEKKVVELVEIDIPPIDFISLNECL